MTVQVAQVCAVSATRHHLRPIRADFAELTSWYSNLKGSAVPPSRLRKRPMGSNYCRVTRPECVRVLSNLQMFSAVQHPILDTVKA